MRLAAFALVTAACAEPVVEMQFQLPANADRFDTSCVTAVEVRALGANYLQDRNDFTRSCIDMTASKSTLTAIRDAIRGQFTLDIPDSGLSGISVLGWSGPVACKQSDETPYYTPDLAFFARGAYIGQDVIDVEATPNLNCASRKTMKGRVVDMFALIANGSSAGCATAMTYPDGMGGLYTGTLIPKLFGKGVDYYGGLSGGPGTNGLAVFDALTEVGPKSCLSLDGLNVTGGSTSCAIGGTPVCADATAGEVELAAIDGAIIDATPSIDATTQTKFPGVIYGSVWTNGAPKTPIAGATVSADTAHAKVVYIDPPDVGGTGAVKVRADQTGTGPSGLFMIYTDTLINVTVNGGGKTRTVMLGATDDSVGGAMIVLQ